MFDESERYSTLLIAQFTCAVVARSTTVKGGILEEHCREWYEILEDHYSEWYVILEEHCRGLP
jgi:hypothetical protein